MRNWFALALVVLVVGFTSVPCTAQADALDISLNFDLFGSPAPAPPPPIAIAPPPLPVYVVPPPPFEGYIWAPGHWRWNGFGYFWVPGTWVQPPVVGVLWTPGYWGWAGGAFAWHEGYWAPHVGFYGGINYGGGYAGVGFVGGGWEGGRYVVNRSVTNVTNVTNITNVTNVRNVASYNGGPGGIAAAPTAEEESFAAEKHMPPTQEQVAHVHAAAKNPALEASANHGKPAIAATARAGDFKHNVVVAQAAGPRNPAAEEHNIAVKTHPDLAPKGAVLPHAHGQQQAKPAAQPKPVQHQNRPAAEQPHPVKAAPIREGEQHEQRGEGQKRREGEHPPGQ